MIRHYFKLDKEQSDQLIKQYKLDTEHPIQDRAELVAQFKKEFHTSGNVVYKQGHRGRQYIIGYEVPKDARVPKWANRHSFDTDGSKCYYLSPKRNFKRGKQYDDWLTRINKINIPSFSEYVVEQSIGDQPLIIFGMSTQHAVAGCRNDIIVLSVPTDDMNPLTMTGDWDFVAIKKSEYVAITEE